MNFSHTRRGSKPCMSSQCAPEKRAESSTFMMPWRWWRGSTLSIKSLRRPFPRQGERPDLGLQVFVRRDDALGPARGPARVYNHRPPSLAHTRQRPALRIERVPGPYKPRPPETRKPLEPLFEFRRCNYESGSRVLEHVIELGVGMRDAQGHGDAAREPYPEHDRSVLEGGRYEERDPFFSQIVFLRQKARRNRARGSEQVFIGVRPPVESVIATLSL